MSQSQHIIVVDDEAPAREMVGDYLKMHGFAVTLCDGGKSLRKEIEGGTPDLGGLDLHTARTRRPPDRPRPEEPLQRAGDHADGDRKPDRPRRRPGAWRRRLSGKA